MTLIRFIAGCLACTLAASAAEPDWPKVEQHATELLRRYVQFATINPPADTRAAAEFLSGEFASAGLKAQVYSTGVNGKANLLVRLPGRDPSKRSLVLLNHMDVVPVDPSRWRFPPFAATLSQGMMWGRGTLDMKSTGMMQLTAVILLKQLGIVPARNIVFVSTCDEETGGVQGAAWMIQHHWGEMNPEYVLDEGAVGSRNIYTPGKLVFGVSIADKQVLWLRVRAVGTSGHASQPIPDNANDLLIRAIEKAKEFPAGRKPNAIVAEMKNTVGTFASNKFMNAIQQDTISLTSLRSGLGNPPKANVIPSVAEATLDCRLLPGENAEEFVSEMKARINDPRITIERISSKPDDPQPSSTGTPLFAAIKAAIQKHDPSATVMPVMVPYGTDASKFRVRGVTAYGIMPMVVDAATLATMHSDSEHIPVDQFLKGLHIYFDILRSDW